MFDWLVAWLALGVTIEQLDPYVNRGDALYAAAFIVFAVWLMKD